MARPLYDVMGARTTFTWAEDYQKSFDVFKTKLTEALVSAYPNHDYTFILDTAASNHSIGAERLQVQDEIERLIGFGRFMLDAAQCHYCTTRKELLL